MLKARPAVNTFLGATIDLLQAFRDLVIVVAGKNVTHITPVIYEHAGFLSVNPQSERGQFSSLRIGLQAVLDQGRDAAFIALVDRPPVLPGTLRLLRKRFCKPGRTCGRWCRRCSVRASPYTDIPS